MSKRSKAGKRQYRNRPNIKTISPSTAPSQKPAGSGLQSLLNLLGSRATILAADGYSNAAAFLGDESPLISSGTFHRSYLTANVDLLSTMYRESWLAMRIIDMPCEDMTRAWYKITTNLESDDLEDYYRTEAHHNVKQEIANAIRWARLYGGSLAVIAIRGDEENLDEPLDLDAIAPGDFQGLLVVDRAQGVTPSVELENNLDDPDFGLPMYYMVDLNMEDMHNVKIHHSRVLRFIGRELPYMETISENYWGASELEHVWDELQKRHATSANIAQLIFQANITTLKMSDFGEALALGTEEQRSNVIAAIEQENRFRTSFGLQLLSNDDTMENHQYTFSGISDIYELFMMDVCGAAEIPATKLFGRSPQGFNSTGESDLKNYYEMISQMQERVLRPALEKLIPVMAISCLGYLPDDLDFVFQPIAAITPTERADLIGKLADPIIKAFQAHIISREDAIAELKNSGEEYGAWTKISADGALDPAALSSNLVISNTPADPTSSPVMEPEGEIVSSADNC